MYNILSTLKTSSEVASYRLASSLTNILSKASFAKSKYAPSSNYLIATLDSSSPNQELSQEISSTLHTFDHGENLFLPVHDTKFHVVVNKRNQPVTLASRLSSSKKGSQPFILTFLHKADALDFFHKCFYVINKNPYIPIAKYRLGIEKISIKTYDSWVADNKSRARIVHVSSSMIRRLPSLIQKAIEPSCPKVKVILNENLRKHIYKTNKNKNFFPAKGLLEDLFSFTYYKKFLINSDHSKIHKGEVFKKIPSEMKLHSLLSIRYRFQLYLSDLESIEDSLWEQIKSLKTSTSEQKSLELSLLIAKLQSITAKKKIVLKKLYSHENELISKFKEKSKNNLNFLVPETDQQKEIADQLLFHKPLQLCDLHLPDMYAFHIYVDEKLSNEHPAFLKLEDLSSYIEKNSEGCFTQDTNLLIKVEKIPGILIKQLLTENRLYLNHK